MALSIAILMLVGLLADWVVRQFRLPGLIGMILVGVCLGPSWLNWLSPDLLGVSTDLRLLALVVILLRAGFELSRDTLHKIGGRALLLAFIPATCEGAMIAWIAGPLLGLTLLEGILLGSVLAAVSPAVVVPLMIRFIKERRGADFVLGAVCYKQLYFKYEKHSKDKSVKTVQRYGGDAHAQTDGRINGVTLCVDYTAGIIPKCHSANQYGTVRTTCWRVEDAWSDGLWFHYA